MIKTKELTKHFGQIKAVDTLNLHIKQGEIFGLLGPNGAGKTTTVRMLNTLTLPTSGMAEINGLDVVREANKVKQIIGVCPQELNLDRELTACENLRIHGLLYRMQAIEERITELLEWCGLSSRAHNLLNTFSGGMQRRLLVTRSIMHRPKVLFLDEPTVGLDPQVRRQIWNLIRDLKRQGVTILLTTHYIEEAELLCQRVGILSYGKLIALGTPEELKSKVGHFVVESIDDGVTNYRLFDSREEAYKFAEERTDDVLIRESNLEDVFIKLTGERIEK
ncbi:multidrug ABC transporter ATP-binding protein [Candidatus Desantisbacteria bacterium CG_4_9_14_3_um_filter_40_11]|uniref:Multidrug ABC transporter ATP-binding protein n=4 Tax=unclassified Candidatus Desantisiibacteriota TaxID=3106372 RepID=A0A2M7JBV5_9BACT|nr:MAG: multidrug ABC transporter ATP-binding protein [Candidatus Desantisbacteria bacterium CG23_combo_of_CG06-09_8_20_14_all_40_23]PIX16889.1 MAG: multidrug ABC transporter ATP-binding protein [Candidatus Desantisbacteria bacterium CG_4_8_14_3_um_filter_40_12]PIY18896.1 MAG: multidrug ABC transporter ATP-binding protein [Candidatus Desantisbacteria bacterium CG_4_10_14_3_um_filter_40_18]PJB29143.1 MAG: multidrug ABC transporter ATP-binding protein [Candidatus Desantisbacteria bacterium CG_4_9_